MPVGPVVVAKVFLYEIIRLNSLFQKILGERLCFLNPREILPWVYFL